MTHKRPIGATAGIFGAGILAYAACCAGPLLTFVGSVGVASLFGAYWQVRKVRECRGGEGAGRAALRRRCSERVGG